MKLHLTLFLDNFRNPQLFLCKQSLLGSIYSIWNISVNKVYVNNYSYNGKELILLSFLSEKEAIKCQIDLMEKEILYFKGDKRLKAKKAYFRLLNACGDLCKLDEPIYLTRTE